MPKQTAASRRWRSNMPYTTATSCHSEPSFSCTCICITNHSFSLTDTAASASAILLHRSHSQEHQQDSHLPRQMHSWCWHGDLQHSISGPPQCFLAPRWMHC
jgi:hypothetical protein